LFVWLLNAYFVVLIFMSMKKIFYTLTFIVATLGVKAQFLSQENFGYTTGQLTNSGSGANVSGGVWTSFSGTGVYIPVTNGSLTYTGYTSTTGNKVLLTATTASAEDDSSSFPFVTTGDIYVSFLLNVIDTVLLNTNSSANGDYFMTLNTNGTTFFSRITIRKGAAGNTYNLGVRHSSSGVTVWATPDLAVSTTQLIIFKYTFVAGATNDQTSLFINPALGAAEPTPSAIGTNLSTADPVRMSSIALRQGTAAGASTPNAEIDGIRIGTAWALGNLPVSWKSFTAAKGTDANILRWSTASETNNSHFEIQRSVDGKNFEAIAKVKGAGNSTKALSYSFNDVKVPSAKTTYYRLKQIDFDGKAEFSKTVSIVNADQKTSLGASLPNPFNTELNVNIHAVAASVATVEVMDMIGKTHYTSTEQLVEGSNKVSIETNDMPNGIYFIRVTANGETFTQKVIKK
jgi:hypothetical protein